MPDGKQDKDPSAESKTEELLKQIREDFAYVRAYWHDNYEQSAKDMDCMAAIPPKDFQDDRAGRPCIWPDETSQYVNQANNNLRQNKRSIKLSPKGDDATDKDAEHRQAYIRGIEDASYADSVYITAAESAIQCAFGYWRLTHIVTGPNGEREPRLRRIPNWATVYPDPDAKEADFSDSCLYFVIDAMRESVFKRKYPKATKRDFSPQDREVAVDFFFSGHVVLAEYWTREEKEAADGETEHKVTQRITNGVEILETTEWIGSRIPIIGVFGKELYVREGGLGGNSKRMFFSMIRRGRAAQQMIAYYASQEAEEFGMAPRAPYIMFKGTAVNADNTWRLANKTPLAYLEIDIPKNWPAGATPGIEALVMRQSFIPNAQEYEIAIERWRRNLQASIAGTPLPTDAQRVNDKSGVALERIENAGMLGNLHFADNFGHSLRNSGEQINELITKLAESDSLPKELLGKDQKGDDVRIKVAPRGKGEVPPETSEHLPESDYFFAHRGRFTVTISEGPHHQSQREEASELADTLIQNAASLGLPQPILQQILSIAIKLKNIGAYGDEIAELLAPPDPNSLTPQAKAILAQAQGQIQMLQQELQKLQIEKMGKVTEIQGKMALADKEFTARMSEADKDRETKLEVAEIMAKVQDTAQRMEGWLDLMKQFHEQAHDLAMSIKQHDQAMQLAQQTAQAQSAQSSQDAAQTMVASAQPQPTAAGN